MKKSHSMLLLIAFLAGGLFSCERFGELYRLSDATGSKVVQADDQSGGDNCDDPCGEPLVIPLIHSGDQESVIGQITVTTTDECLNLQIDMNLTDWTFDQLYLYVGALDTLPLTGDPYPAFWDFPTRLEFDPAVSSYDHCVPLAGLDGCIQILAQVHGVNTEQGNAPLWTSGESQGWTAGPFYTDYCLDDCKEPSDEPCGEPCGGCKMGIFRTQTPGGWGAKAAGNNPGAYRDAHFDQAFPGGLTIGDPDHYTIELTSAYAIEKLLPSGGKPDALTSSYTDPVELKNVLVSHIVALELSVGFDKSDENFGKADGHLGNLFIKNGHGFDGMTIADVLAAANIVLGGGSSSYSPSQMVEILTKINEYFVDGKKSAKYDLFYCK
jgi:hypothetical protein